MAVPRPEAVVIGPHRYTIHWDQAPMDRRRTVEHESMLGGNIVYAECAIYIMPEAVPSHQREILWHEILHGVLSLSGMTSSVAARGFPKGSTVDDWLLRLDCLSLDVLRRNPALVAWLVDDGSGDEGGTLP